jgi:integrase
MAKLTARYLEALKADPAQDTVIPDDQTPCLYFVVGKGGAKSWMVRYVAQDGARKKLRLGRFPAIGLAEARVQARAILVARDQGADPASKRKTEKAQARHARSEIPQNLNALWLVYSRNVMPGKADRTQKYQGWLWAKHVAPRLGDHRLSDIDRAMVRAALREIGKEAPPTANRALALVRHMLNIAVDDGILPASPLASMPSLFKETSRDRVLSDDEIRTLWKTLAEAPLRRDIAVSHLPCAAIKLCLILGARVGDVAALDAAEIDTATRVWTIPAARFKGRRPHTLPLSDLAIETLSLAFERPFGQWQGHAFPNNKHAGQPIDRMSITRAMQRIAEAAGLNRATPHDLRRTMATLMVSERIGTSPHVVSAVLGHKADGTKVTQTYNRHAYDMEKRAALRAWAELLDEIVTGKPRQAVSILGFSKKKPSA